MKKLLENEIFRGFLIGLLGVIMFITLCVGTPLFIQYDIARIYVSPEITAVLIITGLTIFSAIIRSSGHYRGNEEIEPNFFDRLPLEIYLAGAGGILIMLIAALRMAVISYQDFEIVFLILCGIYLILTFTATSIAVRCKAHNLFSNTVVAVSLAWITKHLKKLADFIVYYISNLSLFYKSLLVIALLGTADLWILLMLYYTRDIEQCLFFKVTEIVVIAVIVMRYTTAYQKIRTAIQIIASGDINYKVDTVRMPKGMAYQAQDLNSINVAVANAVTKQMRSEKLKTELITNVSHDIKTPLTSIINYIDLIQKENVQTQPLKDYINVLERQSVRLKKLIEDLVEASKASTGNVTVHLATTGLNLLINQAAAEYTDKAARRNLEISVQLPEDEVYVLSDGRLLWRIFDNLLNNACKYSRPGTRLYMSVEKMADKAVITFKNVSKVQLNISPDELMERFVRGDSSRNTEGSGLGLSIAQSLTEILNGKMTLHIDGDLFKVVLVFDVI